MKINHAIPLIVPVLLIAFASSTAQSVYISKGKIEFEKVVNAHRIVDENYAGSDYTAYGELAKKSIPKTITTYYDLYFNADKSLYRPGREVVTIPRPPDWILGQSNDNIVFNDFDKQLTTAQKHVYEDTYLLQDSLRTLTWKISNDTRTIAGLECRKATAVMMDSVFVVAFFTEQILCGSGPEGFSGLPGMILGIAIPRLHTTWYATKMELIEVKEADLSVPKKGKPINNTQLEQKLKVLFKDWSGRSSQRTIWQVMI